MQVYHKRPTHYNDDDVAILLEPISKQNDIYHMFMINDTDDTHEYFYTIIATNHKKQKIMVFEGFGEFNGLVAREDYIYKEISRDAQIWLQNALNTPNYTIQYVPKLIEDYVDDMHKAASKLVDAVSPDSFDGLIKMGIQNKMLPAWVNHLPIPFKTKLFNGEEIVDRYNTATMH